MTVPKSEPPTDAPSSPAPPPARAESATREGSPCTRVDAYRPHEIEPAWQRRWTEAGLDRTPALEDDRPKFYCLDFFPYPSGAGLSVGHGRNYVPTDVISRYHRMRGYAVLHPMGWDAFGLPAENEAIARGVHPRDSTTRYAATYKQQMRLIGCSYDWEREIDSSQPGYYRWTQWIFLLLYRRGLAYQALAPVNWCETCQTTLANEEVEGSNCWRCHQPVVRRDLKQWFFRITAYADELLADTYRLDWPEHILAMQRNWIGRSKGIEFQMAVADHPGAALRVFTTRADTVYGMTFAVLAPEHPLVSQISGPTRRFEVEGYVARARRATEVERLSTDRRRDGVFTGAYAINPVNGQQVPLFVADYVLPGYGTGAIMAVPAHDQRDFEFAREYGLPVVEVIHSPEGPTEGGRPYEGDGMMVNSGPFGGQPSEMARSAIADMMEEAGYGRRTVQYRMRDWLISRQRYWGTPIPIVHCDACGIVPVPEDKLPVRLPHLPDYAPRGDGRSPLANLPAFFNTPCPACGGSGRRETDTMGGFACSSWYFLRFADPWYAAAPFNPQAVQRWLPVDLYVGGAEHAVMHLLYARFWTKVLADAGLLTFREPFPRLRSQGVVHAEDGKRMSKSRGNVVTPDQMVDRYGADALRLHLLFVAPFERDIAWNEDGMVGVRRFLHRVWHLCQVHPLSAGNSEADENALKQITHAAIRRVTDDLNAFKFNTALATLMQEVNALEDHCRAHGATPAFMGATDVLVRLLAPMAPHITEELWKRRGRAFSIHQQAWPEPDPALMLHETVTLVVQVNGRVRDRITVPRGMAPEKAQALALESPAVQRHLQGRSPLDLIVVPDRLVNVVT